MPISKTITKPNGASIEFHKAVSAAVDYRSGTAIVQVASWPNAESHDANSSLDWMQPVAVQVAALSDIDAHLTTSQDSPFVGGTVVPDSSESLEARKARKWAQIKSEQRTRETLAGELVSPALDSDVSSQGRITSTAVILLAAPGVASLEFTCKDNVRRSFARADFISAALTVGAAVQALYTTASALRADIEAATTVAEIDAVEWPQ